MKWLTKEGNEQLAHMLNTYWRQRGYDPECRVEPMSDTHTNRTFVVRSNMVNGYPTKRVEP